MMTAAGYLTSWLAASESFGRRRKIAKKWRPERSSAQLCFTSAVFAPEASSNHHPAFSKTTALGTGKPALYLQDGMGCMQGIKSRDILRISTAMPIFQDACIMQR